MVYRRVANRDIGQVAQRLQSDFDIQVVAVSNLPAGAS